MSIYLDNAATTQLDKEVFDAMTPYLLTHFGNPSSGHHYGREAKTAVAKSRAIIAGLLNAHPDEITFTSGGTEADNTAILSAVYANDIKHVITTRFEHHAVLNTLRQLQSAGKIGLTYIENDNHGNLNLDHLTQVLAASPRSLVSVMHANNEIGNLNDIVQIGEICEKHNALFHTDTVQTMGHYQFDLQKLKVHFLAASAHKFHGPKGVGFLYCRKGIKLTQLIHGGGQEGHRRAGTENIAGIVGLANALWIAYRQVTEHQQHIQRLKNHLINKLTNLVPGVAFNGNSAIADKSLYTVLSVSLPATNTNVMNYLDDLGIAVSGGSACSTGTPSHVLAALGTGTDRDTIRFSFSKFNTLPELDHVIDKLTLVYQPIAA